MTSGKRNMTATCGERDDGEKPAGGALRTGELPSPTGNPAPFSEVGCGEVQGQGVTWHKDDQVTNKQTNKRTPDNGL